MTDALILLRLVETYFNCCWADLNQKWTRECIDLPRLHSPVQKLHLNPALILGEYVNPINIQACRGNYLVSQTYYHWVFIQISHNPEVSSLGEMCCFFQLQDITKIKSFVSFTDLKKPVHTFISSQLDNCNCTRLSQKSLCSLQFIQNAAARLLTCST